MNNHSIFIADNFNPSGFDFIGEIRPAFSEQIEQTNYLIYFASLNNSEMDELRECFTGAESFTSLRSYADFVHRQLVQICGIDVADIIMLDFENSISDIFLEDAERFLDSTLCKLCSDSALFCNILYDICNNDLTDTQKAQHVDNAVNCGGLLLKTNCYPLAAISKKTGKLTCCYCHEVLSSFDALRLFFVIAIMQNIRITRCHICGKYLLPGSRREIYCEDCRNVTYDSKVQDDARKAYRLIYKMQYARMQRNRENIHGLDERFEHWKKNARKIRKAYNQGELTLGEMKDAISSDSWMYKPLDKQ